MNAVELLRLLQDTSYLSQYDLKELELLAKKYPSSLIHSLLAKKYGLNKHPKAEAQLNIAAILSPDRELLYHFMRETDGENHERKPQPKVFDRESFERRELAENPELREILKSIHERKMAILEMDEPQDHKNKIRETPIEEINAEEFFLEVASAADVEFSMRNMAMEEEKEDQEVFPAAENEVMAEIETEIIEQVAFEQNEDLLTINEIAGAGAEYIPTQFLDEEENEEEFLLDQDTEIQSNNVMEDEFILLDFDREFEAEEMNKRSELESPYQMEPQKISPLDHDDFSQTELGAVKRIEEKIIEHPEIDEQEELQAVNEPASPDEIEFRINETVASPGEFLPDKSFTFSQWLKFFSYKKLSNPPLKTPQEKTEVEREEKKIPETRHFNQSLQDELESIDKMVSSMKLKQGEVKKEISAEELARKSTELNEGIISETLAKIYEDQGRYDKAIRQYVKLSLKFPQKVSFFAARIKELKSKK